MGVIVGLIKWLLKLLIYFLIFALLVILIPNLPPYTTFSKIELEPTQPRVGALAPNEALNNAQQLHKGKLLGPEAFAVYNGELYTSLATGEIVKVSPGGHVTFVTKIGQPCSGLIQEHICGRPLGFEIDEKTNTMYVADAYHGIWKVDLKTDKKQLLVSPSVEISGRQPKLFNSLTLAKNGDFYWTDSSSEFHLKDGAISILTDPAGRLFHYNTARNESKVLLDDLWFPNGLIVSPDNQFVVLSETCRYRLVKYYIDGPKKGKSETFVAGLPGTPDNMRALPDGSGMLVALYTVFDEQNPLLTRSLSETPHVRKFLARLQRLIEASFEFLHSVYPHFLFEEIIYNIGSIKSMSALTPGVSGLVQVDWNGNIVASYYNTDGSLGHVSDALVYNGKLLTGSPHVQNFIGAVPAPPSLLKAFTKNEAKDIPKTAPTPQQTKPVHRETIPAQEKPKVVEKIEAPKVAKPGPTEAPKVEVKPTVTSKLTTQKPIEKKPSVEAKPAAPAPKTTQPPPKQAEQKQTPPPVKTEPEKKAPTPPKQAEVKPTPKPDVKPTPKPDVKPDAKPTGKPEIKTTPPPKKDDIKVTTEKPTTKPVDKPTPKSDTVKPDVKPAAKPEVKPTPKPEIKTTPPKTEQTKPTTEKPTTKPISQETKSKPEVKKTVKDTPKPMGNKPVPQEIPIKEEIPSDTVKPSKETLKVIKKAGPAEIPNPNL